MTPATVDMRRFAVGRFRIFAVAFLAYLAYAIGDLAGDATATIIWAGGLLAVFVALYLVGVPKGMTGGSVRWAVGTPVGMIVIALLYLAVVGRGGLVFGPYCAVALVLGLPRRASFPIVVALATVVIFVPRQIGSLHVHGEQYGTGLPMLIAAGCMVMVQGQARSSLALARSQSEVQQLAADQERLRIARDLHDILGHALTTVTVKAELASRLVDRDPERARREMDEVALLARQGLADVRATVGGYREVTLAIELATAREVLVAAGMTPDLPASTEVVPGDLRELFGWVVREGVTNAVRHSRAQTVRVAVAERSIEVCDDGQGASGLPGSGLTGLRERVGLLGGRLSSGPAAAGGFRLYVEV